MSVLSEKAAQRVLDAINEPEWFSGPPPSIGWWPASFCRDRDSFRWWDGKWWSGGVRREVSANLAGLYAATPATFRVHEIKWQHRPADWPARSLT